MRRHVKLFQRQFIPLILAGTKVTTIRPKPKRSQDWPQPGDILDARAWTGKPYRSKQEKVGEFRVEFTWSVSISAVAFHRAGAVSLYRYLDIELDPLAKRDGFESWDKLVQWFRETHGLPFDGIMIEWAPPGKGEA